MDDASVAFSVEQGDILDVSADVAVFKYAQGPHGADRAALNALARSGRIERPELALAPGTVRWVEASGVLGAERALFVGAPTLAKLGYEELRDLAQLAVETVVESR